MKQRIRELLAGAMPPEPIRSYGYSNGDTYERYSQRCRLARIEPKAFGEWLTHELTMANRRGPHMKLDDHQQFQAG
jgi:hypothetical protein